MEKLEQNIDESVAILSERLDTTDGHLGVTDAVLSLYGDYGVTLGCIALFSPIFRIEHNIPYAKFPGSKVELAVDCFHVDTLHHSQAECQNPIVYKAIGFALAKFWSNSLKENNQPGCFKYDESTGYDVVYSIQQGTSANAKKQRG